MTKGKYKNSAASREAREAALSRASELESNNARLAAENDALKLQVAALKSEVAAGVNAELTTTRQRISRLEEEARASQELLAGARQAIQDTYEGTVRGLMKLGIPLDTAADRVEEVTTFLIGDELLPYTEVTTAWDISRGRLMKVGKRTAAEHKLRGTANKVFKAKDRAAYQRASQGIS